MTLGGRITKEHVFWYIRYPASSSKLPCAGRTVGVKLQVEEFVGSVQLLAWAKENGCPWVVRVCMWAAKYGQLEVLQWAREHHCPWDARTCTFAAQYGHLAVLKWAREHGCGFVHARRFRRARGGAEVGAGAPLRVGREDV